MAAAGDDIINGLAGNDYLEGNAGADTLKGGSGNDTLLAGGGNDSLDGEAGNDELRGGADNDTYHFGTNWGSDLVQDSDGQGSIQIDGLGTIDGEGAKKVAENVWQTADKRVNYTLVTANASQNDLFITFSDRPDVIRIRNWSADKSLGIKLDESITSPPENPALASDFIKQNNGDTYTVSTNNYVSAGPEPEAFDVLNGTAKAETLQGKGGNDGLYGADGADQLDGGTGNDLLLGGRGADVINGGDGDDVIFGSAVGGIATPTAVDFTLPDTTGLEVFALGFSWTATRASCSRRMWTTCCLFRPINVTGAIASPGWLEGGVTVVEQDGNVIDGGAGDDYIVAGTGDDIAQGGEGDDDIIGMDGDDLLAGNAGDDYIFGDGTQRVDPVLYTPLDRHGDDSLLGGAGNDVLIGQGGDDELYGGDGNDRLWTDDQDAIETPFSYHGDDYADGGAGDDEIVGGSKDDTLFGGTGNDNLWGDGARASEVDVATQGKDYLDGEDGDDYLEGGGNNDELFGGAGNDVMFGDGQTGLPVSAHGDDYMDGEDGNDVMVGGGGNDTMYGGTGDDIMVGDAGDDATDVNGDDTLDGGAGADALWGSGGNDQLSGGDGDDTLLGGVGGDSLDGGSGANYLFGGEGNDTLVGGVADYLEGGAGDDTYIVSGDGTSIPMIYDSQGRNTLILNGSAQEYTPYTSGGMTFLVSEGQAAVGFEQGTNLGGISIADGADGKTILALAQDHDPAGRIHSAAWVNGQWISTKQISTNQILQAGSTRAALDGGSGDDQLDGGIGDDALVGGAGNDLLTGGAGADVIAGGAGDDILIAGGTDTADDSVDVYQFEAGDGADRIEAPASAGDGVARDVISFGQGVDAASVRFIRGESTPASVQADFVIAYGNGDTVTVAAGAFAEIAEIRFANGSHLSRANALQRLTQNDVQGASESVVRDYGHSASGMLLLGGDSADQLTGGAGDDTLVGGAGSDVLAGGGGRNVYVFGADSGADQIVPSDPDGEEQVLQFTDAALADLRAFADGQDVVIQQLSGAFVRIRNLASNQRNPHDWQVVDRAGQQDSISQLLVSNAPPVPVNLDQRQADFMARQYSQLGSMPQRLFEAGDAHWFPSVPTAVSVVQQQVGPGEQLELGHYLEPHGGWQITTTFESTPVYETVTRHQSGTPAKFVSLASAGGNGVGGQLPPGAQPVYGPSPGGGVGGVGADSLLGYRVPGEPDQDTQTERLAGWTATPVEHATLVLSDSATQAVVTGTSGNDVINSGTRDDSGLPALFRGSIATGAGDDSVMLGAGRTWGVESPNRFYDWRPLISDKDYFLIADEFPFDIDHGLGAWIDMGDGNDLVQGTDGNDFIIGGDGNDEMYGQAGADTYYISFRPGDLDYIWDTASDNSSMVQEPLAAWMHRGGANDDTVEFDSTVQAASLSYRRFDGFVQLFTNGHYFLDIDGVGDVGEGTAGIEWVRFADGTRVALAGLLDSLPVRETTPPELTTPIDTQHGVVGNPISLAIGSHFMDPDGQAMIFSAKLENGSALPDFLQIDPNSGLITGVPAASEVGSYPMRVLATDSDGLSTEVVFALDVTLASPGNHAPSLAAALDAQSVSERHPWRFTVPAGTFTDADAGDTLTYSATLAGGAELPSWVGFDAATRTFSGTPLNGDVGQLSLTVTATDSAGAAASSTFDLTVANVNDAPVVSQALVAQQASENQVWSFTVPAGTFTDVDVGDTLTYSATLAGGAALPAWLGFNAATRTFSGTPLHADVGALSLSVTAVDRAGAAAGQVFTVTITSTAGQVVSGTAAADSLVGGPGSDRIDGLAGGDTMSGGGGDDTYVVDSGRDVVVEDANAGYDRILSSVTYTAAANVDAITLTGVANISAKGNALDNELLGNSGNNKLDGGPGADKMVGGPGNDTYTVDDTGDVIVELAGEGTDTVLSSISYTLGVSLENLTLTGGVALNGSGNELANVLTSNDAGSALQGLGGDDTLRGGASADTLDGGDGKDRLDGGAGADQMLGDAGNDVYVVDDLGDTVTEAAGEGTDTVQSSVSFTLGANLENLTLTGAESISGTGNDLSNVISGNAAPNTLSGLGGDDTLRGGALADTLNGGDGNDRLDGGAGPDQMLGGAGNDVYVVDDIGDTVIEQADEGIDAVQSSVSFTLGANLENLTLTGAESISGTGNDLSNVISGNAAPNTLSGLGGDDTLRGGALADTLNGGDGNDRLDGGAGPDQMLGGAGNDVYVVDDIGDTLTELAGEGTDTVQSTVSFTLGANLEKLTLTGSASMTGVGNELSNTLVGNVAPNQLRGLGGDDTLNGGAADDTLEGGAGNDRVNGGLGGDTYLFGRGDGQDTLVDADSTAGVEDVLQFGNDIVADQLWLRKVGNNLEVSILGATDKVTISGWYSGSDRHVETFKLANGQRLLDSQVQTLVQAMAAFAPPPAGQTTLPPGYSSIETVVAANWQ